MKCPKCQTNNPHDSRFCKECATPLTMSSEAEVSVTRTLETGVEELGRGTTFAGRYEIIEELGVVFSPAGREVWAISGALELVLGALTGQRAKKGLFITTSEFSAESEDYVSRIDAKVVLIDGETLAQPMIDHGVGVSTVNTYELKKVDSDYFSEE